jgi:hypothetical protein
MSQEVLQILARAFKLELVEGREDSACRRG